MIFVQFANPPCRNPVNLIQITPIHTSPLIREDHDLVVVLDNIRSTLNVGSIFRTADGAGVKHVYCCGTTPTPEHPKFKKTSLGAELLTPWSYHTNGFRLVSDLKSSGRIILAFEATGSSVSIFDEPVSILEQPIALVFGNEISGIDPAILGIADRIMAIPMSGSKTSLNVAVAAGIAIYTIINPKNQIDHKPENG